MVERPIAQGRTSVPPSSQMAQHGLSKWEVIMIFGDCRQIDLHPAGACRPKPYRDRPPRGHRCSMAKWAVPPRPDCWTPSSSPNHGWSTSVTLSLAFFFPPPRASGRPTGRRRPFIALVGALGGRPSSRFYFFRLADRGGGFTIVSGAGARSSISTPFVGRRRARRSERPSAARWPSLGANAIGNLRS